MRNQVRPVVSVGRATGSTKAKLRSIRKRWPLPVLISETAIDPDAYDVSEEEADRGTEMLMTIQGRGARQMADQLQSTHGSSWEDDGPSLAYNAVTVWSDAERKEVIDELHKDGVALGFEGDTLPGLRERILRRRSRGSKVEFGRFKFRSNSKKRWTNQRWVRVGGPGDRCVRHTDCRKNPELGRACCAETRKKERAQLARRKPAPEGRVYGNDPARLVVMNPPGTPQARLGLPPLRGQHPTRPVDDFSIALWAFAEVALEKVGLDVAEIVYHDGEPLYHPVRGVYEERRKADPGDVVAMLLFYENDDEYRAARARHAWIPSEELLQVTARGNVMKLWNKPRVGTVWKKIGNILTWKFSTPGRAVRGTPQRAGEGDILPGRWRSGTRAP